MRTIVAALMLLAVLSCGTTTSDGSSEGDLIRIQGIVEVLHAGTRSETVILTDDESAETFALVGDLAYDLIPIYGMTTAVNGRITEEGYSVREDLRKVYVTDFSIVNAEY